MKFLTLYNTSSNLFTPTGNRQPKNHLGNGNFTALCGVKNVEWMGGKIELNQIIPQNGICKKCLKAAIYLEIDV